MAGPPKMQAKKKIQAKKDECKRKVKKELFSDDKHLPCPAGGRTAEGIYFPNQAIVLLILGVIIKKTNMSTDFPV